MLVVFGRRESGVWCTTETWWQKTSIASKFWTANHVQCTCKEIDPHIGAGGDHDKVQFTPNSEHVNSELVRVSKNSQQAEECNVRNDMAYFPPSSSRQSSLFFTLATIIACMAQFMFHAVTERKFFLETLLKTTRMLKCLFRALWI